MLMGALIDDAFWCLADQYGSLVYNQCLNHMIGKVPELEWSGKLIPMMRLFPFDARVKNTKELKAQRALEARTCGDPRSYVPNPISIQAAAEVLQLTLSPDFDGSFVGIRNSTSVVLILTEHYLDKPMSHHLERSHHVIIDETGLSANSSATRLSLMKCSTCHSTTISFSSLLLL